MEAFSQPECKQSFSLPHTVDGSPARMDGSIDRRVDAEMRRQVLSTDLFQWRVDGLLMAVPHQGSVRSSARVVAMSFKGIIDHQKGPLPEPIRDRPEPMRLIGVPLRRPTVLHLSWGDCETTAGGDLSNG